MTQQQPSTIDPLLNDYQRDFPLEPRPFARIGGELGISEDAVLARLQAGVDDGTISRVGPVLAPNSLGASTLCAMSVPPARLDEVAAVVSNHEAVNHNYEREHALNLWFVAMACDPAALAAALAAIEQATGLAVIELPLTKAYHIDLGFDLS